MNRTTLRLHIDARWPSVAPAGWALLAPDGAVLRTGRTDPAQWPDADDTEAVLAADQAAWYGVRVPAKTPRGELARLLAYALEERLLHDPDSQHLTATRRQGEEANVLVVARERLRQIASAAAALGRPLAGVFSELQCAAAGRDAWHVSLAADAAILRRDGDTGVALDPAAGDAPPPLLAAACAAERPPELVVHAHGASETPDAMRWSAALGMPVRLGAPHVWHAVPAGAANLLHGEFAPRHRRQAMLTRLMPALWLAGAALAIDVAVSVVQIASQRHRLAGLDARAAQAFRQTFPQVPLVDAGQQMARNLDELRASLGQLRSDDALTLLAALADALGADARDALHSVRYEDGALDVGFTPAAAARAAALDARLAARGLLAAVKSDARGTRLVVRRGRQP